MLNIRVVVISSLLSAPGKCLSVFLLICSLSLSLLCLLCSSCFVESFGGRYNLKMKKFFLNNLLFGQSDARVDVREVAEEQELL